MREMLSLMFRTGLKVISSWLLEEIMGMAVLLIVSLRRSILLTQSQSQSSGGRERTALERVARFMCWIISTLVTTGRDVLKRRIEGVLFM